jgi:hypothetical protein
VETSLARFLSGAWELVIATFTRILLFLTHTVLTGLHCESRSFSHTMQKAVSFPSEKWHPITLQLG